jgi:hypothetical protein
MTDQDYVADPSEDLAFAIVDDLCSDAQGRLNRDTWDILRALGFVTAWTALSFKIDIRVALGTVSKEARDRYKEWKKLEEGEKA